VQQGITLMAQEILFPKIVQRERLIEAVLGYFKQVRI
jgi:hypothetical protein